MIDFGKVCYCLYLFFPSFSLVTFSKRWFKKCDKTKAKVILQLKR
jgi:hypothetical protein